MDVLDVSAFGVDPERAHHIRHELALVETEIYFEPRDPDFDPDARPLAIIEGAPHPP